MPRKVVQAAIPNLYFRDGILSIPGYTFERAVPWADTGSMTLLVEGSSLKDGSNVLAKVAPAHSNGSMFIEREAHILERLASSSEAMSTALRMIDFYTIPRAQGDCVVLLLVHPGLNSLGRYFPPSKVNDLLLADASRVRPSSSRHDIYMLGLEEAEQIPEENEAFEIMDLATFLEPIDSPGLFSVRRVGITHREVRANAFHVNVHTGLVRLCHFGNRSVSLEQYGGPSELVIRSEAMDEAEKLKVKEAICYMAPEQTGSVETTTEDNRTDLYSLGVMFWTLLVGRGTLPFEGPPVELLHAVVQKRPMPVHEVRRDLPQVLAVIVGKLLAKCPEQRYQSACGLKEDLLECQRRLLAAVSAGSEHQHAVELIAPFEIAQRERYIAFTLPTALIGRDKELETLRNVIRHMATSYSRYVGAANRTINLTSQGSNHDNGTGSGGHDDADSISSRSDASQNHPPSSAADVTSAVITARKSPSPSRDMVSNPATATSTTANTSASMASVTPPADGLRRLAALAPKSRKYGARAVIVMGEPGAGKSSLILANQAKWRAHGLWGHAKFQASSSTPFSALLSCLSSILRQLLVFSSDLYRFVTHLKVKLGPQLQNMPLLYSGVPELRYILRLYDLEFDTPREELAGQELRARFQALFTEVFSVVADTRLLAIFLDDIHEADDSSLELIGTLMNSRSRLLVLTTLRTDQSATVEKVRELFSSRSRVTWIQLEPLSYSAIATLVARTLHRPLDECSPLSRLIHSISHGNAFSARNLLLTLFRQHHITYDSDRNHWKFDYSTIEASFLSKDIAVDPSDPEFLSAHFNEMSADARRFIIWAALFGSSFKITEVAFMVDWEDSSGSSGSGEETDDWNLSQALTSSHGNASAVSMRGLHEALSAGWLVQRARDMCAFAHDRYRQAAEAEAAKLPAEVTEKMSFRIVLMMLHDASPDIFRVAEHAKRCLQLIREHEGKRDELLTLLLDAGDSAFARGAHETALEIMQNAKALLPDNSWEVDFARTLAVCTKIADLMTWKGLYPESDADLDDCFPHAVHPEDKAKILRLKSRNHWARNDYVSGLRTILHALHILDIEIDSSPSREAADTMFENVRNDILAIGFDDILAIPRATDPAVDLAVSLLGEAGAHAYWSFAEGFLDVVGLTVIQLALRSGISPGTSLGFFWSLSACGERRDLYRFSCDLANLGLQIADRYGGNYEKCRCRTLYVAMVAGFGPTHLRTVLPRLEEAVKLGYSAGDRAYTAFSALHVIQTRLYLGHHMADLVPAAEETTRDIAFWTGSHADANILAQGTLNCIRALAGYTYGRKAASAFDTDDFKESDFLASATEQCGNISLALQWYNSMKVVGLYCLGHMQEAADLGFSVYRDRNLHPNHRHTRYSLFFHSLALIACVRREQLPEEQRAQYLTQVDANQAYIKKWLPPSPVNCAAWVALVEAELASLFNSTDAFRLYDQAVKLAMDTDWPLEEGWALYLQGCHFVQSGVEGLGTELKRRGMARHAQAGCRGIVAYLSSSAGDEPGTPSSSKRSVFTREVSVQTESAYIPASPQTIEGSKGDAGEDDGIGSLSAQDLASILKWSKDISSDINLPSALQRMTEIVSECSGAQFACIVIAREAGDFTVATTISPPELCQVYENPQPVRSIGDPLRKAVIQHALQGKERLYTQDASEDPRFAAEAYHSPDRAIICLPIQSNRGQTFGTIYVASRYTFSQNTFNLLALFSEQASISVANALLFRSVQAGTRENLKMIATQRDALDAARRSREDALKATKIKSNFLASMSHELRTPFSSFYGLLDILDGTELAPAQREIVQTAKQSCDLLLKIIDSILDYSKLEASALKLDPRGFPVENLVADCLELLLPSAAKKLDLSFNIEPDVPPWVKADDARIRQVLMNLIGNAVKFTPSGSVKVTCSVDPTPLPTTTDVVLRFTIQDTGIGLSSSDAELLFKPFQQADNSSTRKFGGTGLGLSISRQLVKLQGGAIGVQSEAGKGSTFWFTIPITVFESEESRKMLADLEALRMQLVQPHPPRVLISSSSEATRAHLSTLLSGFFISTVESTEEAAVQLSDRSINHPTLDFVILDEQSDKVVDDLALLLGSQRSGPFQDTKIIHLYTPTAASIAGSFQATTPGVVKMTKPPRKARLLQTLAGLKNLPNILQSPGPAASSTPTAPNNLATARRTLFGNVLVAEDNPVAQNLLVKQLQRHDLTVFTTNNGEEAIAEWERHEPGFFSIALFDHHMPICDGVEAAKRLRLLESSRRVEILLPIVALSADCQESTKQLCLSAGMNAFLSKPLKKTDLLMLLSSFGGVPPTPSISDPGS
ncbi:histidine kinase [Punctularia strigosozonata HHB-11173 SS5]|uniref:histidine kinase n=1 Tax=Punctularia strigosozonata (strain HHB-11173) TaxID=741275 RepID=UPI0004417E64|nr:histidine kinase [Punctularia strigosozonata HHB-11173 SS5]EIN13359.1 histidine kinase [Punctularia strigosozonata HHB-11173 SS5]